MASATLNDDVYSEDATTSALEQDMARRCGHEAALFVPTGTMANQIALRGLLDGCPPLGVLADPRSHIARWEAGGVATLSGATLQLVEPRAENEEDVAAASGRSRGDATSRRQPRYYKRPTYITLRDVQRGAVLTDDVHACPTKVVSIENTSGGAVVPLAELKALKAWCSARGVAVHVDGARLWEAVAAGAGTLGEFAGCADALTVDFSKSLGAPMGAMVIGSAALVARCRRVRKGIGGGLRQAGVLAAACARAVEENFGPGQVDVRGVLVKGHDMARKVADMWTARGGRLLQHVETNMLWIDLRGAGVDNNAWNLAARRRGVRVDGKRVVLHHQISDDALIRLAAAMSDVLNIKTTTGLAMAKSSTSNNSKGGRRIRSML